MVGQNGLKLAVHLITAHLGDLVAKVCSCLLHRGALSLQEVVRFTRLSISQAKNCLLVLIQHNCVQAFSVLVPGSTAKTMTQYIALFDNILHRMRFPKFLMVVKYDLGHEGEVLLEGLLQNGRLTFDQLVERTLSKTTEASASIREEMRANFNNLVHSHYVERCPKPEPFVGPDSEDQSTFARKRGAKTVPILPLEQQVMMAATLSNGERFSEISNGGNMTVDTDVADHHVATFSAQVRGFRDGSRASICNYENEVLWRANYEKFIQCLKKKACVLNVRSRLGLDAGTILEAMIETIDQENVENKNTVFASMGSIIERVREKPGGISMTLEHVRTILVDQLLCHSSTEDTNTWYTIDLNDIIEHSQNEEVETFIQARYGLEAYRIFRLLIKCGHPVETEQIVEITFIEKKNAQEILYKLWKDEYLEMEKVVMHGSGQTQLFLWKLNKRVLRNIS
uniref:DNA-directed RNA polymerase III subunit RPC3 n=1 Tax=Ananas comosus var. bracteatus TaxID=296719 RepID=A0A6V7PUH1_ANACO|nr:unnamed protein product [Ananas comosus var. bracteatus]